MGSKDGKEGSMVEVFRSIYVVGNVVSREGSMVSKRMVMASIVAVVTKYSVCLKSSGLSHEIFQGL